jgi:N-acetylglutamate synthase-like GNAT family acetyltransferase
MSESAFRVRRAIIDDLEKLRALWQAMHFSVTELEPRLTEFQVAETTDGESLMGAVAIRIIGRNGLVHSEAFTDFGQSDILRPQLWARMQSLATNHGLARLWTSETSPFWKQHGFQPADADALKRLPEPWAAEPVVWLTLRLRDEEALEISLEKEFARFKEEEKRATQKALFRGRALKIFATVLAIVLAGCVLVICVYLLKNYRPTGR